MKEDIIAKLRHDLNNPLTSTKLLIELLLQSTAGELNSQQKDLLKDISTANEKMIELLAASRDHTKSA